MLSPEEFTQKIKLYKQSDDERIRGSFQSASKVYFDKALKNPPAFSALQDVIDTLSNELFENKANLSSFWKVNAVLQNFTTNPEFDFEMQNGDGLQDLMLSLLHMLHQNNPSSKLFDNIDHIYVYYQSFMSSQDEYYFNSLLSLQFFLNQDFDQEAKFTQYDDKEKIFEDSFEKLGATVKNVVEIFLQNKLLPITQKVNGLSALKNPSPMVLHELAIAKKQAQRCFQIYDKIAVHVANNQPEYIAKNMATWMARVEDVNPKSMVATNRYGVHNSVMRILSPYQRQFDSKDIPLAFHFPVFQAA